MPSPVIAGLQAASTRDRRPRYEQTRPTSESAILAQLGGAVRLPQGGKRGVPLIPHPGNGSPAGIGGVVADEPLEDDRLGVTGPCEQEDFEELAFLPRTGLQQSLDELGSLPSRGLA